MVFNHVIRRPCWRTKQWQIMAHVLQNNGVKFPQNFFLFCSVHEHGGDDVKCNAPIDIATSVYDQDLSVTSNLIKANR